MTDECCYYSWQHYGCCTFSNKPLLVERHKKLSILVREVAEIKCETLLAKAFHFRFTVKYCNLTKNSGFEVSDKSRFSKKK